MLYILHIIKIVFVVVLVMFQNHQVIVTSLGYCWYSEGSPQSPSCWSSCNMKCMAVVATGFFCCVGTLGRSVAEMPWAYVYTKNK